MTERIAVLATGLAVAGLLAGCGGSPERIQMQETYVDAPRMDTEEKIQHEWHKIIARDTRGAEPVEEHVGFLDRRFTLAERDDGLYFILDRTHDIRGFVESSGRAYKKEFRQRYEEPQFRNLGQIGLELGIKKILEVPGSIHLQKVTSASTAATQS